MTYSVNILLSFTFYTSLIRKYSRIVDAAGQWVFILYPSTLDY